MWIFTKYGFFSVVCAREGGNGKPIPELLMIRGRLKKHLEALKEEFFPYLGEYDIVTNKGTDYAHRMIVPKDKVTKVIAELVKGLDYSNFKDQVYDFQGYKANPYYRSLHDVWQTMADLQ